MVSVDVKHHVYYLGLVSVMPHFLQHQKPRGRRSRPRRVSHYKTPEFIVALRPQKPYGLLGTGCSGRLPRLSHTSWAQNVRVQIQCCATSTETVRIIRDGVPRAATSTFTAPALRTSGFKFNVALRPQRPYGLLVNGSQGRLPRLSPSS